MVRVLRLGGEDPDSNIYLIIDSRTALVDAGTGEHFDETRREIWKELAGRGLDLLINTHCHYDHAGADHDFVTEFGCEVAIHRIEAKYLRDGDFHFTLSELFFGERMKAVEVSREMEDGDVIDLGELKLQVLHTPGHTAGSICLYEPERRMLFSGDTVFADGIGRTDLPSSDWREMGRSLKRLSQLDVDKIYPGHGPDVERDGGKCVRRALEAFYPELR